VSARAGSNVTEALSVAKLTDAAATPGVLARAFSTRATQAAQVMPSTGSCRVTAPAGVPAPVSATSSVVEECGVSAAATPAATSAATLREPSPPNSGATQSTHSGSSGAQGSKPHANGKELEYPVFFLLLACDSRSSICAGRRSAEIRRPGRHPPSFPCLLLYPRGYLRKRGDL